MTTKRHPILSISLASASILFSADSLAVDITSRLELQNRYFPSDPATPNSQQHSDYLSTALESEFFYRSDSDDSSLLFKPYIRLDQHDSQRSHGDIRELYWLNAASSWQFKAGISKVFWGVTESQHLVDVINQTDLVENIDGEDKLGQPMIQFSYENSSGLIDFFVLPYFRERLFSEDEGRPLFPANLNYDDALYESNDKQRHIDYAVRLLSFLDDLELGISYFDGTSRDPDFVADPADGRLTPFYRQMEQWGLDAQITTDEWLFKLESIKRNWSAEDYFAGTTGFEYTFVGILDSDSDLDAIFEYLYDERGDRALSLFQNDVMVGFRWTMNDTQSTEALLGLIVDRDNQDRLISIEASRRLAANWTIELEARSFFSKSTFSPLYPVRRDDFIQLQLNYYF